MQCKILCPLSAKHLQLKAPGFCNAETSNILKKAPDVSSFIGGSLYIRARSSTDYSGFRISLAANTLNPQFASYKVSLPHTTFHKQHT